MSQPTTHNDDGTEDDLDRQTDPWDCTTPNGTTLPWRDDFALYAHLCSQLQTPAGPSNLPPTPPAVPDRTTLGFCTVYGQDANKRVDGFYEPTWPGGTQTIILCFSLALVVPHKTSESAVGRRPSPAVPSVPTVAISARLLFPAEEHNLDRYGWESSDKRDKAAQSVNRSLGEAQEYLSGYLAGGVPNGESFRLAMGTVLRDSNFALDSDGRPGPSFTPSGYRDEISVRAAVWTDDDHDHKKPFCLSIREAKDTTGPDSWRENEVILENDTTALKPLSKNARATLGAERIKAFRKRIEDNQRTQSRFSTQYPSCVFGTVSLWDTIVKSVGEGSTAAATN